ncbi:four helix bundle protein [Flavobacterium sp.]|uniref:four helix bundle protein n=1 Tax=Flavobacterium sp. TaxID=239 RepID=UPI002B4ADE8D|nr:four helix bundle protein [Flavobacterium sp.]HLP64641.1 four helix bundle protein [Flavobacterium sp.]
MHRFKQLEIWKQSRQFCTQIYLVTYHFPSEERFGLTTQLRRSSVSIPSNIAEGSSRKSNKDFARFLEIAIGSAYEIETQLLISNDLGFITEENLNPLLSKIDIMTKMMYNFQVTLK